MREKYLITDITILRVDRTPVQYVSPIQLPVVSEYGRDPSETMHIDQQIIYLEEFNHSDGRRLVVGMTEEVEKFLGLPMSCFSEMSSKIRELSNSIVDVRIGKQKMQDEVSTLWGWIKWRWQSRS